MLLDKLDFLVVQNTKRELIGSDPEDAAVSGVEEAALDIIGIAQDAAVKSQMVKIDEAVILAAFDNRADASTCYQKGLYTS